MPWSEDLPISKEEFDRRVLNHREALNRPRSAESWERTVKAQNEDRWLFPLAMNELAREENGEPEAKKS